MSTRRKKTYCPVSDVYDINHIRQFGYNCPYRHREYKWPAVIADNFTLVSDSLCKFVHQSNQVYVQSYPGATVRGLCWKIGLGKVRLCGYKIIVLHVGTNDLISKPIERIVEDYEQLILSVRKLSNKALIGVSAIIPRPIDERTHKQKRISVNKALNLMCKDFADCIFLRTYKPFERNKLGSRELFAKDGLHLSRAGAKVMKSFINSNIITLQERLK